MQWTPAVGDDFRVRVAFAGTRRERAESAVWGTCGAEVWLWHEALEQSSPRGGGFGCVMLCKHLRLRHEALERLSRDDGAHDGALVKKNLILGTVPSSGATFRTFDRA
jgi:hypothetical protein